MCFACEYVSVLFYVYACLYCLYAGCVCMLLGMLVCKFVCMLGSYAGSFAGGCASLAYT